jgi:hypothetical protein
MSGKWSQPDVPHKGWECVGFEDLEEPSEICEMCEVQEIRYVHEMAHRDYPRILRCGCICASNMELDYTAAYRREVQAKNQASRRSRWLTRRWKVSSRGNEYLNANGFNIVIFRQGSIWKALVSEVDGPNKRVSQRDYASPDAAKLAAFDVLPLLRERWHPSD